MRRPPRPCIAIGLALVLGAGGAERALAQVDSGGPIPHTITLRVDNDVLDFWEVAGHRPDEDYTSGVRLVYDNAWTPWWASKAWRGTRRCVGGALPCLTSQAGIGQDMYTAERNPDETPITVGARPNVGWLYYAEEIRRVDAHAADRLDLTLGVTGPPSLAQYTQEFAHSFSPNYHRPVDWSHQIPFEPGVIATYERDMLVDLVAVGPIALQAVPSASANAGNISDRASGTFQMRLGYDMPAPWRPVTADNPLEITATAGITGFAVARDLFLDGSTFRGGPRVGHLPFYLERELGGSMSYHRWTLGYRAVFDAKTYATGRPHAWGSLTGGLVIVR